MVQNKQVCALRIGKILDFQDSIYLRRMGIFRIGISHDDRDGGSKCVPTGSICVPKNIMILKKSESSRKELSGFFCVFTVSDEYDYVHDLQGTSN